MIKRKKKQKKSNFVESENPALNNYTKGAFLGALVGGVSSLFLGKKIMLGIIIGAIGGGYISYQIHNEDSTKTKFNIKKFTKFKNNEDGDNE